MPPTPQILTLGTLTLQVGQAQLLPLHIFVYLSLTSSTWAKAGEIFYGGTSKENIEGPGKVGSTIKGRVCELDVNLSVDKHGRVKTTLVTDAGILKGRQRIDSDDEATVIVELYKGHFLEGMPARAKYLHEGKWEEWHRSERQELATIALKAHLRLAQTAHDTSVAERHRKLAQELMEEVGIDESELGLEFLATRQQTAEPPSESGREGSRFLGRQALLAAIQNLPRTQWCWIRGAKGYGKTALIRELNRLSSTVLFNASDMGAGVSWYAQTATMLLIDDWSELGQEAQDQLLKLRERVNQSSPLRVVITDTAPAPPDLRVDAAFTLGPLSARDLESESDEVFALTGGHPLLVFTLLDRGELAFQMALRGLLSQLTVDERKVLYALTICPTKVPLQRRGYLYRALGYSAEELERHLAQLSVAGFLGVLEQPVLPESTLATEGFAETGLFGQVALKLARIVSVERAWPLLRRCDFLWEVQDGEMVVEAAHFAAHTSLEEGEFSAAYQVMLTACDRFSQVAQRPETQLLLARTQLYADAFKAAHDTLKRLAGSPLRDALFSWALRRLGRAAQAQEFAHLALKSSDREARLVAASVLGHLARERQDWLEAQQYFATVEALADIQGSELARFEVKSDLGILEAERTLATGEALHPVAVFEAALAAAEGSPALKAAVLVNRGKAQEGIGALEEAVQSYVSAQALLQGQGNRQRKAIIQNNLASVYHQMSLKVGAEETSKIEELRQKAEALYISVLREARVMGDEIIIGVTSGNLSELQGRPAGLREAIRILRKAQQNADADYFQQVLDEMEAKA